MPECSFHGGVETNVSCAECGRWICARDMVDTPVGYKCRVCAAPARTATRYIKPRQLALAALAALAAALFGGILLGAVLRMTGFFLIIIELAFGAAVGEAARRGSGGHRGAGIAAVAGMSAMAGGLVGGLGLFGSLIAVFGAAGYVLQNRI